MGGQESRLAREFGSETRKSTLEGKNQQAMGWMEMADKQSKAQKLYKNRGGTRWLKVLAGVGTASIFSFLHLCKYSVPTY